MRRTLLTLVVGIILTGITARAHHSFAAAYFEDQSVTMEGVVSEFEYRNPHAILRFNAKDAEGVAHMYAAEWSNPGRLAQAGVTKDTLKAGDVIRMSGSPGRVATEYKLHLKQITRPADGWTWGGERGGGRGAAGRGARR